MTLYPNADTSQLLPDGVNHRDGGVNRPPRGVVLHIAQGSYDGTINWQHNPAAQVSSYLVIAKDGRTAQLVDFDNRAWTQSAGNDDWIGIEHEGNSGDSLTPQQIEADAQFYAWAVKTWGLPVQITDDPINGRGLGWHGMGGNAWGGHFDCPGAPIVAQRQQILDRVNQILGGQPTGGFLMALTDQQQQDLYTWVANLYGDATGAPNKPRTKVDDIDDLAHAIASELLDASKPGVLHDINVRLTALEQKLGVAGA